MADKTAPQANDAREETLDGTPQTSSNNPSKSAQNGVGEGHPDPRQRIFAARFHDTTDAFGEACEKHGVTTAIAIVVHPEEEIPLVFVRGHEYDVAALLTRVLRNMKGKLLSDLDV